MTGAPPPASTRRRPPRGATRPTRSTATSLTTGT
uniref:Uncharacterized protein n=1 Tax=Arundo donax TaxID=35708 RepID=A0A0A9AU44_ARUDO